MDSRSEMVWTKQRIETLQRKQSTTKGLTESERDELLRLILSLPQN